MRSADNYLRSTIMGIYLLQLISEVLTVCRKKEGRKASTLSQFTNSIMLNRARYVLAYIRYVHRKMNLQRRIPTPCNPTQKRPRWYKYHEIGSTRPSSMTHSSAHLVSFARREGPAVSSNIPVPLFVFLFMHSFMHSFVHPCPILSFAFDLLWSINVKLPEGHFMLRLP